MTVAVIGDVHGCVNELQELLDKITAAFDISKFVYSGDLLDKGYDSPGVVKLVREYAKTYDTVLVEGNHEERNRRFRRHLYKGQGQERKMHGADELLGITKALSKEDVAWLNKANLYHKLPEHNALVVHAGISPSINKLPPHDYLNKMPRKKRKHYEQMLRVRYVNPKGYMVTLGAEKPEDEYWADIYDGRYGKIFFGHQPFMQDDPKEFDHAIGLDLGCVFGGKLCAAILQKGKDVEFITVQAHGAYAKVYEGFK